ncbi:unnamed protein product, partial [Staurois parvus]
MGQAGGGGVMVWWIHPALYPQFRLVVVVSWFGGFILPCIHGSGWLCCHGMVDPSCLVSMVQAGGWWCHGVVDPSCLVSMVQAGGGGVMVWCIHPASYHWFRLVLVVSW